VRTYVVISKYACVESDRAVGSVEASKFSGIEKNVINEAVWGLSRTNRGKKMASAGAFLVGHVDVVVGATF
jgi:hypothetical protein